MTIDQGWLVNEWSGGGFYEVTVVDSAPTPRRVVWRPYWDVNQYPEKIPPTLAAGARPGLIAHQQSQAQPQPQPMQVSMSQFPGGLPSGGIMPQFAVSPAPQLPQYQPYYQQQTPMYAMQAQAMADSRRLEERLANAEAQLQASRLEAAQRQHQVDLERERASNVAAIQRLEARIAEMAQATQAPKVNDQVALLQAQLDNERREREMERRELATRELIERQVQAVQKQIEAMQQNHAQLLQAQQNRGPDPMIQLLMEQNRNSMEAMKEISRQSTGAIEKFQTFMMNPRDVMSMTREASNGLDVVTQKMSSMYSNVLDMQQKVIENAMQLNQGGSETIGLIRDGVSSAKELAERYFTVKGQEARAQAQSQAVQAQAQAQSQAIQAQAQAQLALAQAQRQQPAAPAQPRPQAGLGGTPQPSNVSSFDDWRKKREEAQPPPPAAPRETVGVASTPTPTTPAQTTPSDQEWLGPLFGDVVQLRQGVEVHLRGLQKKPAVNEGVSAATAAQAIATAAGVVMEKNIPIPAMIDLLNHQNYGAFMARLLPGTPEAFRNDIIGQLKKLLGDPAADDAADDDEEDDLDADEDGEHTDDVRDGAAG